MDIKNQIGEYFFNTMKITDSTEYTLKEIDAKNLFCAERLDLIVKYMYISMKKLHAGKYLEYVSYLYKEHLKALNEGVISEPGNPYKNSIDDYVDRFDELYIDIKQNGFNSSQSVIPMSNRKIIIDGGHRVAISALLNRNIVVASFDNIEEPNYNYEYFLERGMKVEDVECMLYNYVNFCKKRETYVCCVWPTVCRCHQDKKIEELIKCYGSIIYKKKFKFTYDGLKALQILAYSHQDWVGTPDDGYDGVDSKVNMCFANADTTFYIIEGGTIEDMLQLKEKIRNLFKIGKHSVHITDNFDESIVLLRAILNKNSLWMMNNCNAYANKKLIKKINSSKISENEIFNPNSTLALFGKDNVNNMDFNKQDGYFIDCIYDYSNFFWYADKKFLAPKAVKNINTGMSKFFEEIEGRMTNNGCYEVGKAYRKIIKYKAKKLVIQFLHKAHLFDIVYKTIKSIRR